MNKFSKYTAYILWLGIIVVSIFVNQIFNVENLHIIQWDGYGYYLHLPANFIFNDAHHFAFAQHHLDTYPISTGLYQIVPIAETANAKMITTYNIGMSILWLPFFLIAHICAATFGFAADGMSYPYQLSIWFAAIIYIGIGIYFLRKILLYFFTDKIVATTLIGIYVGTNFLYYCLYAKELTHIYLFAIIAAYVWHLLQYQKLQLAKHKYFAGLLFGFAVLIRSSEIVLILLPMFYGISFSVHPKKLIINFVQTTQIALVGFCVFALQIFYFKYTINQFWANGYKGHGFQLLHPRFQYFLFGWEYGWLLYSPLCILFFIGFYILYKKLPEWFYAILTFFIANCWLLFSWKISYGSTFGCRPITQSYAIMAIAMACCFYYFSTLKKVVTSFVSILFCLLIYLNIFQTYQYMLRIIPKAGNTKNHYLQSFWDLKRSNKKAVLFDVQEYLPLQPTTNLLPLFKSDSVFTMPPSAENILYKNYFSILINDSLKNKLSNNWLQVKCVSSYWNNNYSFDNSPTLTFDWSRNNQSLKWNGIKLPICMENKMNDTLAFTIQSPTLATNDVWKVYLQNHTADSFKVSYLQISTIKN